MDQPSLTEGNDAPPILPIRAFAHEIEEAIEQHQVVVIIGETGSGKTTQISQIIRDAGLAGEGCIGITQPRRVAAVTVAKRVAEERRVEVGAEVGYSVRFEGRCSSRTRIKYLTDGTLLRELLEDPSLLDYSVVVLDEAHERSLNTDILFGLLKQLTQTPRRRRSTTTTTTTMTTSRKRKQRDSPLGDSDEEEDANTTTSIMVPPLKLVITSATLDANKFSTYFNQCPVFNIPGRTFPVEIIHSLEDHTTDYEAAAIDTALDIHCNHPASSGDILMFLTGQAEIDRAVRALNENVRALPPGACEDLVVLPLYAALPPEMQARVFSSPPAGVRRCIVATNIAETSVTVDGVVYVIDPGTFKLKHYNPRTGMDSLGVVPISRVQAAQRAGRAGRTRPGICYRLYTKHRYEVEMASETPPEIQRTSLVAAVLFLKSLQSTTTSNSIDVLRFDFIDAPERVALEDALRQLFVLDAIDRDGKITEIGREMVALPLDPSLARALLAARQFGCLEEMVTVASMLSPEGSVFLGGKGPEQLVRGDSSSSSSTGSVISVYGKRALTDMMADGLGDHVLLLRLWQSWQSAGATAEWCKEMGVDFRAMRFARDVRRQLDQIVKPAFQLQQEEQIKTSNHHQNNKITSSNSNSTNSTNSTKAMLRALRKALTIGFANRLARRMSLHNGYRTLGESSALAQIHPSAASLYQDDQGLLPQWVVYHELVSTGRVYLSGVCPVESSWVESVLPKLQGVDVVRLSGGDSKGGKTQVDAAVEGVQAEVNEIKERRNDDSSVDAARARYAARKAAAAAAGGGKGKKR